MQTLLEKYNPLWSAEDGSGGGDPAPAPAPVDDGGDPAPEVNDPPAGGSWLDSIEGLSDDDKTFVGDRDAKGMIEYARSQRQAASKRAEDVAKEGGYIQPLGEDGDPIAFAKEHGRAAKEVSEFIAARGLNEDDLSSRDKLEMESALEAGMSAKAFTAMKEKQAVLSEDLIKEQADEQVQAIKDNWGADYERNNEFVQRAVQDLGWTEEDMVDFSGLNKKQAVGLTEKLAKLGEYLSEGGNIEGVGDGVGQAQTLEQQLKSLEEKAVANNGNLSPEDERKKANILDQMYKEAS